MSEGQQGRTPLDPLSPIYCPLCGRGVEAAGLVDYNEKRERVVIDCSNHGEIEVEWSRRLAQEEQSK